MLGAALAETHQIDKPVCLIVTSDIPESRRRELKCEQRWVFTQDKRWRQVWALPLRNKLPEWPAAPTAVPCNKEPTEINLVTMRITFPKQFVPPAFWELAQKKPVEAFTQSLPEGTYLRSFGWHVIPKEGVVMGLVKTSKENSQAILAKSGAKHLFAAVIDKDAKREPVKWLQKGEGMSTAQYLADARRQAQTAKTSLALRKGEKFCLGLIGVDSGEAQNCLVKRWVARGVPSSWIPSQVQEVLTAQNWRVLSDITPPQRKGGLWVFKGALPAGDSAQGSVLQLQGDKTILISPWIPKVRKPDSTPLRANKAWITVDKKASEIVVEEGPEPEKEKEEDDEMNGNGAPGQPPGKRKEQVKTNSPAKTGKAAKVEGSKTKDSLLLGPNGVERWDLGGTGDCGFRCLAAQQALRNQMPDNKAEEKAVKLGLSLRALAQVQLSTHSEWQQGWYQDPECTTITEDGDIASSCEKYMEVIKRPNKWLDPWLTQACMCSGHEI